METKPINKFAYLSPLMVIVGLILVVIFRYIEIHVVDAYFPVNSMIQLFVFFFFSLLAFLFGVLAVVQLRLRKGEERGVGMAISGIMVGMIGAGISVFLFLMLIGT